MLPQLFTGTLRHRRFYPKPNRFTYNLKMWYLDLDDLPSVKTHWYSPFRFHRLDYFDKTNIPLKQAVIEKVKQEQPEKTITKVFLLTQMRCFGYVINPISIYYCFNDNRLQTIIAEVTNTPWGEKKIYVLDSDPNKVFQRITFKKAMHVSPFNPMNMDYEWLSNTPNETLKVHLNCLSDDKKHMDATLSLKRSTTATLSPWATWKVVILIYAQAFKLFFIKRIPFYSHDKKK